MPVFPFYCSKGNEMIVVIFEVETKASEQAQYLALAAQLKERLAQIDGFISIERFQSLAQPGKLLSLSFWRDEEAVKAPAQYGTTSCCPSARARRDF